MKSFALMVTSVSLIIASWAQAGQTKDERKSKPMQTLNETARVSPALEKYAQGPLTQLWKRPGLSPRDRSMVTIAALIARNQTIEMPYYFNVALDNGVKPAEISEIITHLAFYSGWENAMSAVAVAKRVFTDRKIGLDQLPPASPTLLPLDKTAEAKRAANVEQQFGNVASWSRAVHCGRSVPGLVVASGSCATGSKPGYCERAHCFRPGCANRVPPQSGNGQRPDADTSLGSYHASGLLRRLAERFLGPAGRKGCFRKTYQIVAARGNVSGFLQQTECRT